MEKRDLVRDSVRNSILFARHVVPAAVKPARTLWNEVIGFIFIVFAVGFGFHAITTARQEHPDTKTLVELFFSAFVALVMVYYAISSFRKARRISRS